MNIELFKNLLMSYVSILSILSYIPQLVKLVKTKKSDDISLTSWLIWVSTSLAYFIYACLEAYPWVIFASGIQLAFNTIILLLAYYYQRKKNIFY